MASEEIQRHVDAVRALAKPGAALGPDAPTSSIANPRWWVDGEPTPGRRRLHRAIQGEVRDAALDVLQECRALVLAGPPGAGKGGVKADVLGDAVSRYRNIDADEFKAALLDAAARDGSLEQWLKPDAVRDLEAEGEKFFPLELASLVHEESSYLSKQLRARAIAAGENIIVDTVLAGEGSATALGDQLAQAGYMVQIVDVEVPFELSEQRIRSRWEKEYVSALEGGEGLGGRWVPSEYARDVFDSPAGHSKPERTARLLAERCPAVVDYRVYRTGMDQAHLERAQPVLEVHMQRSRPGAALRVAQSTQAPAVSGPAGG